MTNQFKHNVLGEYKSEERWLKILPREAALKLLAYEGIAFMMGIKLGTKNWCFMVLAVCIGIFGLVWTFLSIKEKDPADYQKGGGIIYTSIFKRRLRHKKEHALYALGIGSNGREV